MRLKEDAIPKDKQGRPDISRYTDSAQYYVAMYQQYLDASASRNYDANLEFRRRVHATWGLIAKGVEAVPHALAMLKGKDADAREDGAAILAEVGKDSGAVEQVLEALAAEKDATARDSMVLALGALKARAAIPALAGLIRDAATDGDTRWTAVESLGRIVRRRFVKESDPVKAAIEWLAKHEKRDE